MDASVDNIHPLPNVQAADESQLKYEWPTVNGWFRTSFAGLSSATVDVARMERVWFPA